MVAAAEAVDKIQWEEVKVEVNTHRAAYGFCNLTVSPLPRKGPFTVMRSELGDNWTAQHHAKKHANEFSWQVWVGERLHILNVIGHGTEGSVEKAKEAARKFLADWAEGIHLAAAGKAKGT